MLTGHTTTALTRGDTKPPQVSVAVVCHCGQAFGVDELEAAQAHVVGHIAQGDNPVSK